MSQTRTRKLLTSLSQLETSENTTFIIQNTIRAAARVETILIASGVSLVFDGGMIAGALSGGSEQPLKLVGNFTSVEAPITQIFGDTVTASGYWHIDRAYPQWFDAVAGTQSYYASDPHDCSVAINKAVEMKMSGEVFLPACVYLVSHTIRLRHGINLIGDSATRTKIDDNNKPDPEMVDSWGRATYITPFLDGGESKFTLYQFEKNNVQTEEEDSTVSRPVIVTVNIKSSSSVSAPVADMNYAHPFGSIEQIYFYNPNYRTETSKAKDCADMSQYVCCLVAGGFSFRHVFWENFCRAIKWTQDYNDSKTIYRCNMQSFFGGDVLNEIIPKLSSTLPYLIDLRGCGDAMIIDGCHLDRGVYKESGENISLLPRKEYQLYKAIAMRTCLGGSIRNSIIHSDIDIEHCIALEFADNHCELGMQMNIRWSQISIHDNFIEKGIVPNFVVHAMDDGGEGNATYSNLNFSDNKFICYNYANRIPVYKISEYDILLKTRQGIAPYSIDLARNYRVTANSDALSMQPTGIMLATQNMSATGEAEAVQPFTAFNDHSYFLSDHASIHRDLELEQSRTFASVPEVSLVLMNNTNIPRLTTDNNSLARSFVYKFYAQVIMDEDRRIVGEKISITTLPKNSILNYKSGMNECGILIRINWKNKAMPFILRLVREATYKGSVMLYEYVDVPVCGARFLHDNSISVEGHLWIPMKIEKAATGTGTNTEADANVGSSTDADGGNDTNENAKIPGLIYDINSGLESIWFSDDNVCCQAQSMPINGEWKTGDTIVVKPLDGCSDQEWIEPTIRMKK